MSRSTWNQTAPGRSSRTTTARSDLLHDPRSEPPSRSSRCPGSMTRTSLTDVGCPMGKRTISSVATPDRTIASCRAPVADRVVDRFTSEADIVSAAVSDQIGQPAIESASSSADASGAAGSSRRISVIAPSTRERARARARKMSHRHGASVADAVHRQHRHPRDHAHRPDDATAGHRHSHRSRQPLGETCSRSCVSTPPTVRRRRRVIARGFAHIRFGNPRSRGQPAVRVGSLCRADVTPSMGPERRRGRLW
jgi:hypothetical protein